MAVESTRSVNITVTVSTLDVPASAVMAAMVAERLPAAKVRILIRSRISVRFPANPLHTRGL